MKNPQITTRLNNMMIQEKAVKLEVITLIMDNYRTKDIDLIKAFDILHDMDISQLNDVLSDLISELYANINYQLERFKARN